MELGSTPNLSITPLLSRPRRLRRSNCTTRVPWTHWARSLSGVLMTTRLTRVSCEARKAAHARLEDFVCHSAAYVLIADALANFFCAAQASIRSFPLRS